MKTKYRRGIDMVDKSKRFAGLGLLLLIVAAMVLVPAASALPQYASAMNKLYGTGSCAVCHKGGVGGAPRTPYGLKFEAVATHSSNPTAALKSIGAPPGLAKASITVTVPNGGESWKRGTTHTITWKKVGSTGSSVKIELLKGTVATLIKKGVPNSGSFKWAIKPTQAAGTNYKIRITSTTNPAIKDTSNSNFIITV
jgi:hypothetical protein